MPLYEYKCDECEQSTDIYMKMDEKRPETIECGHCGATAKRVFSTGAAYIKKVRVEDVWKQAGIDPDNKTQIRERQNSRIKKMRERAQAKINTERNKQ